MALAKENKKLTFALKGAMTNLVTPFTPDDKVDYDQFRKLIERQIENKIDGLIPMGTTGENFNLSTEEHMEVNRFTCEVAAGRVPVVAGTGSNSTAETIALTRAAKEAGASACLVTTPYYNKPSQEGMFQHFKAVGEVGLPIVVYNVPGRSVVALQPATVQRLFDEIPAVVGIKEASGNMDIATDIMRRCPITVMSGDDSLALPLMSLGAAGVMSVAANIVPAGMVELTAAAAGGDFAKANAKHMDLFPLFQQMVAEVNPVPVKQGMNLLGLCPNTLRLPLLPASEGTKANLTRVMTEMKLL